MHLLVFPNLLLKKVEPSFQYKGKKKKKGKEKVHKKEQVDNYKQIKKKLSGSHE